MSKAPDVSSASVRVSETVSTAIFKGRKSVSVICGFPVMAMAFVRHCLKRLWRLSRFVWGQVVDETLPEIEVSACLHRIEAVWVVR